MNQLIPIPAQDRDHAIARVATFLRSCLPGKKLTVIVEQAKRERTDAQGKALWGHAYRVLREFTGSELDEIHTVMCGEFFSWTEYEVMGYRRKKPRRTTTTDEHGKRDVIGIVEFCEFYAMVERKASEIGCFIPSPDPEWFLHDRKAA